MYEKYGVPDLLKLINGTMPMTIVYEPQKVVSFDANMYLAVTNTEKNVLFDVSETEKIRSTLFETDLQKNETVKRINGVSYTKIDDVVYNTVPRYEVNRKNLATYRIAGSSIPMSVISEIRLLELSIKIYIKLLNVSDLELVNDEGFFIGTKKSKDDIMSSVEPKISDIEIRGNSISEYIANASEAFGRDINFSDILEKLIVYSIFYLLKDFCFRDILEHNTAFQNIMGDYFIKIQKFLQEEFRYINLQETNGREVDKNSICLVNRVLDYYMKYLKFLYVGHIETIGCMPTEEVKSAMLPHDIEVKIICYRTCAKDSEVRNIISKIISLSDKIKYSIAYNGKGGNEKIDNYNDYIISELGKVEEYKVILSELYSLYVEYGNRYMDAFVYIKDSSNKDVIFKKCMERVIHAYKNLHKSIKTSQGINKINNINTNKLSEINEVIVGRNYCALGQTDLISYRNAGNDYILRKSMFEKNTTLDLLSREAFGLYLVNCVENVIYYLDKLKYITKHDSDSYPLYKDLISIGSFDNGVEVRLKIDIDLFKIYNLIGEYYSFMEYRDVNVCNIRNKINNNEMVNVSAFKTICEIEWRNKKHRLLNSTHNNRYNNIEKYLGNTNSIDSAELDRGIWLKNIFLGLESIAIVSANIAGVKCADLSEYKDYLDDLRDCCFSNKPLTVKPPFIRVFNSYNNYNGMSSLYKNDEVKEIKKYSLSDRHSILELISSNIGKYRVEEVSVVVYPDLELKEDFSDVNQSNGYSDRSFPSRAVFKPANLDLEISIPSILYKNIISKDRFVGEPVLLCKNELTAIEYGK